MDTDAVRGIGTTTVNGPYTSRSNLWVLVEQKILTPKEAQTIEDLWTREERNHRLRWSM